MEETTINDIKVAIERSGFPLEHYIGLILKKHNWQIITNRNYIDDIKGVEREIDILAYKLHTDKVENIDYITTLIISCKKSDKHKWCFLTRDMDENDCNINLTPFHYCTSDERLRYMTEYHLDTILERYKGHRAVKHLYSFDDMVFAYQQLAEPSNDKDRKKNGNLMPIKNEDIYNSISTTIKAISNEKESRLNAYDYSTKQRYYTFHALSIFEGEMYKSHFDSNEVVDVSKISNIKYLNRHIVGGIDDFYIVHFINKEIFDYRLRIFDYLHEENVRTLPKLMHSFYNDIFNCEDRLNMYWKAFEDEIKEVVRIIINGVMPNFNIPRLSFKPSMNNEKLELIVGGFPFIAEDALIRINNDEYLQNNVKELLKKYFRYEGGFTFVEDNLPF